MEFDTVKKYYQQKNVVQYYSDATKNVGLWKSEEDIFLNEFKKNEPLLEIGCGAGRIAIGLSMIGYKNITAIDYASDMVKEAQRNAKTLGCDIDIGYGDAMKLEYPDESFAGAIFGFNGLMQIPKRVNRCKVLKDVFRILTPGSSFVFTTYNREEVYDQSYWKLDKECWERNVQQAELDEYGDVYGDSDLGCIGIILHNVFSADNTFLPYRLP